MAKGKKVSASDIQVGVPNDFLPMYEWLKWFYRQQLEGMQSFAENWETCFIAGNGTGKTAWLYHNLVSAALGCHGFQPHGGMQCARFLPNPPLRIKVLVNDFEHGLDKVAYEAMNFSTDMPDGTTIGPILPKSMIASSPTKEDKSYRLKNGSVMFFMTSEQKRKLHSGTNFDVLACDEEAKEQAYDESKRGLRRAKGGGRILHSFTPPLPDDPNSGPSWTKFKMYDPWQEGKVGKPDLHVIRACMKDNPAINEEFIERFSHGKTETQIRVQVYGDYPSWGKLVHPGYEDWMWEPKKKTGHLLPWNWEPPWRDEAALIEFAIDWHSSKPAAALWTYEDRDGNVIVFDEFTPESVDNKTISEVSDIIRQMEGGRYNTRRVKRFGDPKMKDKSNAMVRGFNAWDEFRNNGIFLHEGYNKQPEVGISIVNDFIMGDTEEHPRVFVRETCENLRRAMRNHYWVTTAASATPDPKWSDYPICLRYILQRKARKVKKGMYRGDRKNRSWGLTSYDGLAGFGPYTGHYVQGGFR